MNKGKIAYLSKIQLTDTDFSYLHEAQQLVDMTCYMEVSPRFLNGPAISLKKIYNKTGIFKAIDIYPEFEKYRGFIDLEKFYVVNTSGKLWQLKSIITNIFLLFVLIRQHYKAIHVAWPLNVYELPLYVFCKRMILTVHDPFPHTAHDTPIVRLRRKIAFRLIRKKIILNLSQRQKFLNFYGFKSSDVIDSRLSNCPFLRVIDDRDSNAPHGDYIIAFGRICEYKGFDYLLPAMVKVHEKHPQCKLIIAGKGDFHFDITKYKALDYIDFRNRFIPDEEMVGLIKNALFMVCPYTDATQSGVVMSSYAFYRPVIASNVGGLPEMVVNGRHGLIIKERDVDAIVEAIDNLLSNREKIDAFSRNIQADYTTGELSWRSIATKLVAEYDKL